MNECKREQICRAQTRANLSPLCLWCKATHSTYQRIEMHSKCLTNRLTLWLGKCVCLFACVYCVLCWPSVHTFGCVCTLHSGTSVYLLTYVSGALCWPSVYTFDCVCALHSLPKKNNLKKKLESVPSFFQPPPPIYIYIYIYPFYTFKKMYIYRGWGGWKNGGTDSNFTEL